MTRTRRCAPLIATVAVVLAMLAWPSSPVGAQTPACPVSAEDQAIDAQEQALLGLINQYRQSYGKPALAMHSGVTRAAAWFSRDMATKNYFPYNHVDSNGRTVDQRLAWCGVTFSNWAENIYAGSGEAQRVFDAWRTSSGHNANLLRDGVTSAGIARAYNSASTYKWYWTLDLTNSAPTATTTTTRPTTTTTTAPVSTTTTTTRPTTTTTIAAPTTTTTTVGSTPTPGTAEWYWWYWSSWREYYGR